MKEHKIKDFISGFTVHLVFILFGLCCIVPIIIVLSISLSNELDIIEFGYRLIPKNFDLTAYEYIFKNPKILLNAYGVTIFVTVGGTLLSLIVTALLSYPLSRKDYIFQNKATVFVFFTMLFGGGLVPWYVLISQYLGMKDTIWVLILPYIITPWNVLLLKTYFKAMPHAIVESAKIDGASEWVIFMRLIIPLSKPALATVALFISLSYWNDWWLSLLFIDNNSLVPLQLMLNRIMGNIDQLKSQMQYSVIDSSTQIAPSESARMAMCMLAMGPMLFTFPFFQKYFVKGLTVGAIKG